MTIYYIITRFDIVGPEFRKFIFGGEDIYKTLACKSVEMDKACRAFFSGTGKIFITNCYKFNILFISYIHFLTHS